MIQTLAYFFNFKENNNMIRLIEYKQKLGAPEAFQGKNAKFHFYIINDISKDSRKNYLLIYVPKD